MPITATGIGSGLDVESIVAQLVAADRSPTETRITRQQAVANYTLSALSQIKSAMSLLRDNAAKLFGDNDLKAFTATSSKTDLLTATATSSAIAGDYAVTVENLAKAHKMVSGTYADPDALVGAGQMTITAGVNVYTINTDADTTLGDLRAMINEETGGEGLSASLITEDGGTRLVLTATETGVDNAIELTSTVGTFTDLQTPEDAVITVEGYTITRPTNSIDDAIEGVTLNLVDEEPGTAFTVTINPDNSKASKAILNFVNAYNSLVDIFTTSTAYDADAGTAGALNGDAPTRAARSQLRQIMTDVVGDLDTYGSLSSLGIEMGTNGKFTVDSTALNEALEADFNTVAKLFSDEETGLAFRIDAALDPYLDDSSDGEAILDSRIDSLNNKLKDYDKQLVRLDDRMARVEELYRNQFNSLDAIVNQYSSIASFLTQNFSSSS